MTVFNIIVFYDETATGVNIKCGASNSQKKDPEQNHGASVLKWLAYREFTSILRAPQLLSGLEPRNMISESLLNLC